MPKMKKELKASNHYNPTIAALSGVINEEQSAYWNKYPVLLCRAILYKNIINFDKEIF
jgi:hypothetical protein